MIPEAVAEELSVSHVLLPPWIQIQGVRDRKVLADLCTELDLGESEAIALAVELGAEFLLMDEKRGRAVAAACGAGSYRYTRGGCGRKTIGFVG